MIKFKLIFVLFVFAMHCISTYIVYNIGEKHYNPIKAKKRHLDEVWDLGYEIFPNLHNINYINNCALFLMFLPMFFSQHSTSILKDITHYLPIIIFIRSFMIVSTILPRVKQCKIPLNLYTYINGHCYDKIFSGHVSLMFLLTLIYLQYNVISIQQAVIINIIISFITISTRNHYTIDTILAYLITYAIYNKCLINLI